MTQAERLIFHPDEGVDWRPVYNIRAGRLRVRGTVLVDGVEREVERFRTGDDLVAWRITLPQDGTR